MTELDLSTLGARAVLDVRGQSRLLGSLWRNQPAVLVWLRHFACLFCKEQASEMRSHKSEIEDLGGRLAFVGSGTTAQAQNFRDHFVPGCAVFTDPSSYTYRTIGAKDSMSSTVAGFALHGARALRHGYLQTWMHPRAFQQGGVLVACPENRTAFAYISRVAGDHPPLSSVLGALERGPQQSRTLARDLGGSDVAANSMSRPWPRRPPGAFQWRPPPSPDPS
jgi:hypothetical protein